MVEKAEEKLHCSVCKIDMLGVLGVTKCKRCGYYSNLERAKKVESIQGPPIKKVKGKKRVLCKNCGIAWQKGDLPKCPQCGREPKK